MPIFTTQLKKIDTNSPQEALRDMANHIRYIQEQLEWTLMNLDSTNINEIDTDETNITSGTGGSSFTGNSITLNGANGESFSAGMGANNVFQFKLNGKSGQQILYLTSSGELVITKSATISIDGGEW